jgi:hypothetical protein
MYELFIHGIGNEKMRVDFGDDEAKFHKTTIKEVKLKLIKDHALPIEADHIRLLFTGKQLEDGEALSSYDIINRTILMSVIRMRGGVSTVFI